MQRMQGRGLLWTSPKPLLRQVWSTGCACKQRTACWTLEEVGNVALCLEPRSGTLSREKRHCLKPTSWNLGSAAHPNRVQADVASMSRCMKWDNNSKMRWCSNQTNFERLCENVLLESLSSEVLLSEMDSGDFPGNPVVRTVCFHWGGPGFDPWLGN